MNHDTAQDDPQIVFYDLDYPWPEDEAFAQAASDPWLVAPVRDDIDMVLAAAKDTSGPVLDLCCGTGRLSVPLARAGFEVTAVDVSEAQIARLRWRLEREPEEVRRRVTPIVQDVTTLPQERRYGFVLIGFNSLNLMGERGLQRRVLSLASACLAPGGLFFAEMANPFQSNPFGSNQALPMHSRIDPQTRRRYQKFGMPTAMTSDQKQVINGWYDVIEIDGMVRRLPYRLSLRFIFSGEFELMLEQAGLEARMIAGDHRGNPYGLGSRRIIALARKPAAVG